MKIGYTIYGDKIQVTDVTMDLGEKRKIQVIYPDGTIGWEIIEDIRYPHPASQQAITAAIDLLEDVRAEIDGYLGNEISKAIDILNDALD